MGAGIAQLGCLAGMKTLLHDPVPEALKRGEESVRSGLEKGAARGRWSADDAAAAAERLHLATSLDELSPSELVIEAAPERSDLKRELFGRLSEICGPDTVLATNTSSIPVTSLASAAVRPENVVGMHFFNPPPLMRLLEVIAAAQSEQRALDVARATGELMGKRVILAKDGPGFLVNRCGRPYNGEALKLLQERIATPEQIDRICRLGGGYRMGPFELMDLVGIDVGFEVAKSFTELSFGEPRWKPSPLQAQKVAAGTLGRKTGSGWYEYGDGRHRPEDPEFSPTAPADEVAAELGVVSCASKSLGGRAEHGFSALPDAKLVELTGRPSEAVAKPFDEAGFAVEWVADAPGLVLGRIVCQLVNEAAFAIGEGVGSAEDIDAGMELGLNHPRGPIKWGEAIGLEQVLATIDGLWEERREERYRAAPLLRHAVATGTSLG
jgi:3-hydroxybutyryl-CoA dehydrogenase